MTSSLSPSTAPGTGSQRMEPPPRARLTGKPMAKILVVDDNRDNLNVVSRMLELRGHRPSQAENGREALERARAERPDLVLMDLSMPEMDGWQASRHFQEDEDLRDIPVVAVTGHVTQDEIARAQQAGCVDVVSKPIDFYVLMDKIALHTTPVGG